MKFAVVVVVVATAPAGGAPLISAIRFWMAEISPKISIVQTIGDFGHPHEGFGRIGPAFGLAHEGGNPALGGDGPGKQRVARTRIEPDRTRVAGAVERRQRGP